MARPLVNEDFTALTRFILGKIEIYFDGLSEAPFTVYRNDYLVDFTLLEEVSAESESTLGAISANELTFTLFNTDKMFSPNNEDSPFYGKITVNVPVRAYLTVDDENEADGVEWLRLGTFYVDDWNTEIDSSIVSVTCTDLLRQLLNRPMPALPIILNESYANFFIRIFTSLGVASSDIVIDGSLVRLMQFGYTQAGSVIETLQPLAEAALCYIFAGRDDKIYVSDVLLLPGASFDMSDTDFLVGIDIPQTILKTYSSVELTYSQPSLSDDVSVLMVNGVEVTAGLHQLSRYKVDGPVYTYSYVRLIDGDNTVFVDLHATSWEVTLDVNNSVASSDTITLEVFARKVNVNESILELNNPDTIALIGEKPYTVENLYIQNTAYANLHTNILLNFVSHDVPTILVNTRGNPLLTLGQTVSITDATHEVEYDAKIIRAEYIYNGALSASYDTLNLAVLEGATRGLE